MVPAPEQQLVLLAVDPAAVLQSGTANQVRNTFFSLAKHQSLAVSRGQAVQHWHSAMLCLACMQQAAQQAAAVVGGAPDVAESFDANPRSMEAAVANLARFTSDTPAGAAANNCKHSLIKHRLHIIAMMMTKTPLCGRPAE